MKTGIITFHFAHNYGAMLQAYALMSHMESIGHEVSIINYTPQKLDKEYTINPLRYIRKPKLMIKQCIKLPIRFKQYNIFNDFLNQKMKLTHEVRNTKDLIELSSQFNNIIVGSDQVWNEDITGETNSYFLDFVQEGTKKISYAASFGKHEASSFIKSSIRDNLPSFHKVSVREDQGIKIIQNEIEKDITHVCDPVFLLNKDEWTRKIESSKYEKKQYILYYSLQENEMLKKYTEELSRKMGLPVYSIHPLCKTQRVCGKQLNDVGPIEFLDLIKNAEVVCTNSFHAVAFSIIFERKLLHIAHNQLSSRVESLLRLLDVNLGENSKNIDELIINPSMINYEKLKDAIKVSNEFLDEGSVEIGVN